VFCLKDQARCRESVIGDCQVKPGRQAVTSWLYVLKDGMHLAGYPDADRMSPL
jgi:hypothetical protein